MKYSLLLLLIIAILAGFVYLNQNTSLTNKPTESSSSSEINEAQAQEQTNQRTENTKPESNLIKNESKQYKSYSNTTHKYKVTFPSDWDIDISEANNLETYKDSSCCNTAVVKISNGKASWEFSINRLYTGFQAPMECEPGPNQCQTIRKQMTILGNAVERVAYKLISTGDIVSADIHTPSTHPGFGKVGYTTEYVSADHIKYFIHYSGDINNYLTVLDTITQSLEKVNK